MKNSVSLLILSLSAFTQGCVKPPDIPLCRELSERRVVSKDAFGVEDIIITGNPVCEKEIGEPRCGYCVWTISEKTQYVGEAEKTRLNKLKWSEIRPSAVLLPAESYAKIKEFIINSCKKNDDCQAGIDKWRAKLGDLEVK